MKHVGLIRHDDSQKIKSPSEGSGFLGGGNQTNQTSSLTIFICNSYKN